jgi:hypothetical protein
VSLAHRSPPIGRRPPAHCRTEHRQEPLPRHGAHDERGV